ncbi:MAG: hypothetical protein QM687_05915 [Ferruginibacter sp.]
MKNTFFLIAAGLMLTIGANAQTKKKTAAAKVTVPEAVDASFKTSFANAQDSKWSKNYTGNYVATFKNDNNLQQTTEYNSAGVLLKTKTTYDVAALPENVTTSVEAKYAGSKIETVERFEIPGVAPYYKVKLVTADTKEKEILLSDEGAVVRS